MVGDRRISFTKGPPNDDGCKVMTLETTDGVALLGYAGLGLTIGGTEPADWMSNVLRGRKLPLEKSLGVLADALKRELPKHLAGLRAPQGPAHHVVIPAFVGEDCHLYSIDLVMSPDRKKTRFRYTRHLKALGNGHQKTPRVGVAGSGLTAVQSDVPRIRGLLRLVRACDRGRLSHGKVADELAALNESVSAASADGSVGHRCVVVWRNRKNGRHKGGGGHHFYTGRSRDSASPALATIATGMDVRALVQAMMPHFMKSMAGWKAGKEPGDLDENAMNEDLCKLPEGPDETLK
jgi:hypothetical protein